MTEAELDRILSEPTPELVASLFRVEGDILVVGASGKMGPSLTRMAVRASEAARTPRRIIAVARFSDPPARRTLDAAGIETIACDLFDRAAVDRLPDAANVIYMAGRKFGTSSDQPATWATNAFLPGLVADRFAKSRLVAFSTGNVYPLSRVDGAGPRESDPVGPIGEYAEAALGRERVLEYFAQRHGTPMAILRLNYAIEPRYGVLRDIADKVYRGEQIDVAMGYANIIWQRDANAIALRALEHCTSPPLVVNVTGAAQSIRDLALRVGQHLRRDPHILGVEGSTALLSNAGLSERLFGPLPTTLDEMIAQVSSWVASGGRSLQMPTHFEEREGRF